MVSSHVIGHNRAGTWEQPAENLSSTIEGTPTEVVLRGPGLVKLSGLATTDVLEDLGRSQGTYDFSLRPAGSDRCLALSGGLDFAGTGEELKWVLS